MQLVHTEPAPVHRAASGCPPPRTSHGRLLPLTLAALWLLDGLLQLQAAMFTPSFATHMLARTAEGNPAWIARSIEWSAGIVAAHAVWTNTAFAGIQLALGLGIAWRRTTRVALAASVLWSLSVWWFGEGLGGVLRPGASALTGAPGAVLLYAVLAVLVWPAQPTGDRPDLGTPAIGRTRGALAKTLWVALWGGLALLDLEPSNLDPDHLAALVEGQGSGQPAWLGSLTTGFARLSEHHGTGLTVLGTAVLLLVAVGILLPAPLDRGAVVLGVVVAVFVWVVGEALGGPYGGMTTDPDSGPLLALIALACWPPACRRPGAVAPPLPAVEAEA